MALGHAYNIYSVRSNPPIAITNPREALLRNMYGVLRIVQSNGKKGRFYQTLKSECIRPGTPLSLEDARRLVAAFVEHYNTVRLHSALGYVAPADKLEGRAEAIWAERDPNLAEAREARRLRRAEARRGAPCAELLT